MNYLLIFGVAILQTIISAVWFSPLMFGKFWMKVNGVPEDTTKEQLQEMGKKALPYYILQFLLTILTNSILLSIINLYSMFTTSYGYNQSIAARYTATFDRTSYFVPYFYIIIPLFIWIGFMMPVYIQSEIWTKSDNSLKIKKTLVVGGQLLVVTLLAGLLFGLFRQ
jgi:Protein of unknown function (DUF1761)